MISASQRELLRRLFVGVFHRGVAALHRREGQGRGATGAAALALLVGAALGCGGEAPPPPSTPSAVLSSAVPPAASASGAPAASASAAPPAPAITSIEPMMGTFHFSDDEAWSAVDVELRPSGGQAIALVEEQGGQRRLARLVGCGETTAPQARFVGLRRLLVHTKDASTLYDITSDRKLDLPPVSPYSLSQRGRRLYLLSDRALLVVDAEAMTLVARAPIAGSDEMIDVLDEGRVAILDAERRLAIVDSTTGRELRRFEGVSGYLVDGRRLAAAFTDDAWKVALFDIDSGRRIVERRMPALRMGPPDLSFSPDGRSLLISYVDYDAKDRSLLTLERLDAETGALKGKHVLRPSWSAEHAGASLTDDGRVCVMPQFDLKNRALAAWPIYDFKRASVIEMSPSFDRLCAGGQIIDLPASLHGPRRQVVPSVRVFGMGGGLFNNVLGREGLLARVETDRPTRHGDPYVGPNPKLVIVDTRNKKTLFELPLPELGADMVPDLDVRFSPDGQRLAVVWNGTLFLVDIATRAFVAPPLSHGGYAEFSPRGRYVQGAEGLVEVATGKRLEGPWWTSSAIEAGACGR